ncbi:MAG: DUF4330 domain-containing protein [Clostridia bacterium]|nr:DUF4330 domain-containing protein [Clostridia bacterium]
MFKKDGKLFGKISIIDILAIVAVVVLALGVYLRFSGQEKVQVSSGEPLECVMKVENIREYTVEALKKGGAVFDKDSKEYIGEITGVTSEQGTTSLLMNDGTYREVPTENRYNAYVTIAFSGKVSDNGYYTNTNQQIAVGSGINLNAKFAQCESKVYSVKRQGE